MTASVAPCGDWTEDLARNYNNTNYTNFGCATQTNLAAMIVNPLDLLYPRLMTPPNAARRGGVLQNYQNGNATDTNYPGDFGGGIAGVGQ
jgi:pilus assembly protein CpaD